ncbi:hypothetical protein [Peribacillus simplex]|uniref:hypothetical protein n=1 Tax=Peribacillus simplex TaxID=1478 RepID=UPI003D2D1B31
MTFSLSMLFFVLRTRTIEELSHLSGMAQSIDYMIGASCPILFGIFAEWTNSWTISLIILMVASIGISIFGFIAVKSERVIIVSNS